jgi:serine/threonine protein kinase
MTSSPEHPGTELIAGKYKILKMLGRGGMGSVWEGQHVSLGTRVAIKFIDSDHAHSTDARARFETEAKSAASLQSKYAIQIYDHGVTEDGRPYMVMEFLSGEPLDKRIERIPQLPLTEVARIIQQVSRGLAKAHEKGIIHRDLKPENIYLVVDDDEGGEIAKVLDFGIAKLRGDGQLGLSSGTRTGAILGTPYYMSPEQARGLKDIDHRSDLWSLGVIAYRCAVGRLPFDGESVGDLLVKICTSPVPVPSHLNPALPQMFDGWFAKALERDPNGRFSSAAELAESLAQLSGITVRKSSGLGMPVAHQHTQGISSSGAISSGAIAGPPQGYGSQGSGSQGSGSQQPYSPTHPFAGVQPNYGHASSGRQYSPYSNAPLAAAAATSAGLSTSTGFGSLGTPKKSNTGKILLAIGGVLALFGVLAAAGIYVLFHKASAELENVKLSIDSVDSRPAAGSHDEPPVEKHPEGDMPLLTTATATVKTPESVPGAGINKGKPAIPTGPKATAAVATASAKAGTAATTPKPAYTGHPGGF